MITTASFFLPGLWCLYHLVKRDIDNEFVMKLNVVSGQTCYPSLMAAPS
jgi:hypothetical protein